MEEDVLSDSASAKQNAAQDQQVKEKTELAQKYKAKGAQNLTLKEYLALKEKKAKAKKTGLPAPVKLILATPFILIGCFGVLYIPYVIFQIAVGKPAPAIEKEKKDAKKVTLQDLMKEKREEEESWIK